MQFRSLALFAVTLLGSAPAFAGLIEDGSAFTGKYLTQQDECAKVTFDYATGKKILDYTLTLWGTPDGLSFQGPRRNMPMMKGDIANAKPNSGGTNNEQYVSPTEFREDSVLHFESNAPVDYISEDYRIDGTTLTVTNTRLHPVNSQDNRVCRYGRTGDAN